MRLPMVRTRHTRVTGAQEDIQEVQGVQGVTQEVPDTATPAMDLLRGRQEGQGAILAPTAPLTPAVDLLQVVPRPP